MRHLLLAGFTAYAALVAACSSLDNPPAAPSTATADAVPSKPASDVVPAAPEVPSTPAAAAAVATTVATPNVAKPKDLKSAMKGIEDDWKLIETGLEAASADLPAMAKAAERVAAVMKLGYDPFDDKEVPNFAQFARESEAAFLDLAKKAAAGDAAGVKAMGKTLQPQHCARCHDAYGEVHG
jgi:hypothetical protein